MHSISDLVREQLTYSEMTHLTGSLGDGFLYSRNLMFRKLRDQMLRLGVTFSARASVYHYRTCPHLSFEKILYSKKIPYFKNVSALIEMQSQLPNLNVQKILEIKKNKVMHESAHLFAQSILGKSSFSVEDRKGQNREVLKVLLSESYASACETVGQIFSPNEIHEWMYRQNTNVFGCEGLNYRKLLKQISEQFGIKVCFNLSILSFLCWHFFFSSMSSPMLNVLLSICGTKVKMSSRDRKSLLEFSNYHFLVRNWFRDEVAEFYFYSQGFQRPLAELLKFDFFSYFLKEEQWQVSLKKLVEIIEERPPMRRALDLSRI